MNITEQNQEFIYQQLLKWKKIAEQQQIIINLLLDGSTDDK